MKACSDKLPCNVTAMYIARACKCPICDDAEHCNLASLPDARVHLRRGDGVRRRRAGEPRPRSDPRRSRSLSDGRAAERSPPPCRSLGRPSRPDRSPSRGRSRDRGGGDGSLAGAAGAGLRFSTSTNSTLRPW